MRHSRRDSLALNLITGALFVSAWLAAGSLLLAIVDGRGEQPVSRILVGAALVASFAAAIVNRRRLSSMLRRRPWLVVPAAVPLLAAVAVDEPVRGAYVACTLTPIGLAALVARAFTVWACVGVLTAGYALAVLSRSSPAELASAGDVGTVIASCVGYPLVALLLLGVRRLCVRAGDNVELALLEIRAGNGVLTPALGRAVASPGLLGSGEPVPAAPAARLTRAEIRVIEMLADGYAPKQAARALDVALGTIRTHIKRAKRKTGARTLRELAGLTAHPSWPDIERLER